jgi:RNA exonuclease 4
VDPKDYCLSEEQRKIFGLPFEYPPAEEPENLLGLDCEMVRGLTDDLRFLARISLVSQSGEVIFDSWVKPTRPVGNYKTHITGATREILDGGIPFDSLPPPQALGINPSRTILCGHGLVNDFSFLPLSWRAWPYLIDTVILCPHPSGPPAFRALKDLASEILERPLRSEGEVHSSVKDAKATVDIVAKRVSQGFGYYAWYSIHKEKRALFDETYRPTLPFLLDLLGTNGYPSSSIKGLYLIGSRGLGTAAPTRPGSTTPSDWDFIGVYDPDSPGPSAASDAKGFVRYGNIDIALYSLKVFRGHVLSFEPGWHEAIWGDPEINRWYEDPSLDFRQEVRDLIVANPFEAKIKIHEATNAALSAKIRGSKRAFREENHHRAKSLFFVGLRFLAFGQQLATRGSIEDIRLMNDHWFRMKDDPEIVDWKSMWSTFKKVVFGLQKELGEACKVAAGSKAPLGLGTKKTQRVLPEGHPFTNFVMDQTLDFLDVLRSLSVVHSNEVVLEWLACGPLKLMTHSHRNLVSLRYSAGSPKGPWTSVCRGIVVDPSASWAVVARPFDRFFPLTPETPVDWDSAYLSTKEDGSLAILYRVDTGWCVASASQPDASRLPLASGPRSFSEEFWYIWKEVEGYPDPSLLDPSLTYIFELVTPSHVIIVRPATPSLSLLGLRSTLDGREIPLFGPDFRHSHPSIDTLRRVETVKFSESAFFESKEDRDPVELLQEKAQSLDGRFHEGWVVTWLGPGGSLERAKIKAPDYTRIAWLCPQFWHEELATPKRLFQVLLEDEVETFRSHCPHFAPRLDPILAAFDRKCGTLEEAWQAHKEKSPKEFAAAIGPLKRRERSILFLKRRHPGESWLSLARLAPKLFLNLVCS